MIAAVEAGFPAAIVANVKMIACLTMSEPQRFV